jgi:hypothetical protein
MPARLPLSAVSVSSTGLRGKIDRLAETGSIAAMTRVIPPREAMPSEAAVLRRRKPGLFRWSVLRSGVLRAAAALIMVRAALYWLAIFGADGGDFLSLALRDQILVGALAMIATMAGVGLWMLALWGVALWIVCLGVEIGAHAFLMPWRELVLTLWRDPFIASSIGLFVLFLIAAILSAVEQSARSR